MNNQKISSKKSQRRTFKPQNIQDLEEQIAGLLFERFGDVFVNIFEYSKGHYLKMDVVSDAFNGSWVTHMKEVQQELNRVAPDLFVDQILITCPVTKTEFANRKGSDWKAESGEDSHEEK